MRKHVLAMTALVAASIATVTACTACQSSDDQGALLDESPPPLALFSPTPLPAVQCDPNTGKPLDPLGLGSTQTSLGSSTANDDGRSLPTQPEAPEVTPTPRKTTKAKSRKMKTLKILVPEGESWDFIVLPGKRD